VKEYAESLIDEHVGSGIVLDTGLLLLLIIGNARRELVGTFKRLNSFAPEDYDTLTTIVNRFQTIATTPNILTEVSNLADSLTDKYKEDYLNAFAGEISLLDEKYVPTKAVLSSEAFSIFGLSDAVIAEIANRDLLVMTTDGHLYNYLLTIGLPVLNFNHIRTRYWT
jgi:hypothetical protein